MDPAVEALILERDELKAHAIRLNDEVETAMERLRHAEFQRDTLLNERDELKGHAERLSVELDEARAQLVPPVPLFAPPGHFYSPVVDPGSVFVGEALAKRGPMAEIELDSARMQEVFAGLARWYGEMPFPREKAGDFRYYFENPAFGYTDAFVLYAWIRTLQPGRIVEVGCGYSTCVIFDTVDRFCDRRPRIACYDPYPDVALGLTAPEDPLRGAIEAITLQEIPDEVFTALEADDILFIDSSHIAKTGSDVVDYMFRALPLLKPGVYVHIHDIGYPFEYSKEWVVDENRSWNEGYLLRAFLMYNPAFEIVFWNPYFVEAFPEEVGRLAPVCLNNGGGSIWLRRR